MSFDDLTPDDIHALEAGRETDALVAMAMGWRWMQYPPPGTGKFLTGLFPPDAPGRMCVPNGYDAVWLPSDATAPRFSNWEYCYWREGEGELLCGFPKYSADIQAAWDLREPMKKHDRNLHLIAYAYDRTYAKFAKGDPGEEGFSEGNGEHTTPLAICKAFLLALKKEDASSSLKHAVVEEMNARMERRRRGLA